MTATTYAPTSAIPTAFPGRPRAARTARAATAAGPTAHPHRLQDALRALKVFSTAAFGVVVLGDCPEEAGVRRR